VYTKALITYNGILWFKNWIEMKNYRYLKLVVFVITSDFFDIIHFLFLFKTTFQRLDSAPILR
jgi:hypothetical protein